MGCAMLRSQNVLIALLRLPIISLHSGAPRKWVFTSHARPAAPHLYDSTPRKKNGLRAHNVAFPGYTNAMKVAHA